MHLSPSLRGAFLGLGAMALYCFYDVTIKLLGGAYSPLQILFCAGLVFVPLILGHLLLTGQAGRMQPVQPGWIAVRVVAALLNGVLGAYAFAVLPLAQAYAVFFLMPLMISLLAVPVLGEPMDRARGFAILAGLAGVMIALQPGAAPLGLGHLAAFSAAALGALNYVILRKTSGVESPGVLMLYPAVVQLAFTGVAMLWLWVPMPPAHWALTTLMGVELMVGGLMIIAAYRIAPAIVVAPMQYSQIIWAAILGALFFGEAMDGPMIVGIAIIIAAGQFLLYRTARPATAG
jgi:S-adenosylmethionine uptake transporter